MSSKETIQVVDFPDNVRLRKSMYIPNKDHNIFEIIDNSVDEYAAGRCNNIALVIKDDVITIEDDGGGMPIKMHPDKRFKGLTEAEVALTTLHAGGKFGGENSTYKVSGGLN